MVASLNIKQFPRVILQFHLSNPFLLWRLPVFRFHKTPHFQSDVYIWEGLPSPAVRSNEYGMALCNVIHSLCHVIHWESVVLPSSVQQSISFLRKTTVLRHGKKKKVFYASSSFDWLSQQRPFKRLVSTFPNSTTFTPFPLR